MVISKLQLFRIHKWCGLVACILIIIQSTTGIVEAYRVDIAQLIDPSGMIRRSSGNNAPLRDVIRTLQITYPDHRVERIVFPENLIGTYFAHLINPAGKKDYASIDPGSAKVLRYGRIWAFPSEAAARIHYDYAIGLAGMAIVALTGVLGIVMAVTGVAFWWPPAGRRFAQLRINWRLRGRLVLRQLHRSTGAVMALLFSFSLATGLTLAIYYFIAEAGTPPGTNVATLSANGPDIDTVVRRARSLYPGHDIRDVRFVAANRADVYFHAPERNPRAAHHVGIDLRDGWVTATLDAKDNKALWVIWLPLHSGELFGILGKVLVTFNAVVLFGLALSGPIMWSSRVAMRLRRKSASRRQS